MKYPQSFIEEIRNRTRVSELIGRFIPIKRAGREYHALCPFHKEKTPSFTINDEKGFFHCFGCGAHGDCISFIMQYEHLGYREAIEKLATAAGMAIPQPTRAEVERVDKEQSLQQVLEAVTGWMEHQLHETQDGELARNYLRERGLSAETIATFRIGYAPSDRDALAKAMKQLGISQEQLVETGMLIQIEGKLPYSRFRRRLMFPIRDRKSRVVAFGGRVLPGEPNNDAPKYLNSPETPLFHKGRQLYNLDRARRAAFDSRQLIIAEGYMDVVALAQAGIAQAVAPLGTAVTAEQLQICWQLVDEPTLCLDGDSAGQRAMTRAMELALPLLVPGKTLKMAILPKGEDPDSLIRTIGKSAFEDVIKNAQALADALWEQAFAVGGTTPEARAAYEQNLLAKIGQIKHASVQHYYRQFVRERLRAMQSSSYARHSGGSWNPSAKGKKKWIPNSAVMTGYHGQLPTLPPPIRSADASLLAPASKLMALVIAHPLALNDSASEEFWLHAPMPAPWQHELHQLITELHISNPELTAEQLWQTIEEEASGEMKTGIARALESLGIALTMDETTRVTRVQRLWGEVVNDVDRTRLKAECVEAETLMGAEMSDENFQRFMALKSQLEALERERVRFYQQDPLPAAGTA
jgi:DNA primase